MQGEQAAAAPLPATTTESGMPRRQTALQGIWKFIRRKPLGAIGFGLVIFLFLMTLGPPTGKFGWPTLPDRPFGFEMGTSFMARYDDQDKFYDADGGLKQYGSPDFNHWFGTDNAGRDTVARSWLGRRFRLRR